MTCLLFCIGATAFFLALRWGSIRLNKQPQKERVYFALYRCRNCGKFQTAALKRRKAS